MKSKSFLSLLVAFLSFVFFSGCEDTQQKPDPTVLSFKRGVDLAKQTRDPAQLVQCENIQDQKDEAYCAAGFASYVYGMKLAELKRPETVCIGYNEVVSEIFIQHYHLSALTSKEEAAVVQTCKLGYRSYKDLMSTAVSTNEVLPPLELEQNLFWPAQSFENISNLK